MAAAVGVIAPDQDTPVQTVSAISAYFNRRIRSHE